ncbi:PREDICTED: transcription factor AP-1-like [Priapulus caudatus]|uniref:Transcription factor AP-1-like n=1 Tax=Priapulus caudatus TaxID=37621 RepID=A0ABM1EPN4_PRICU|nr:PREDICTED: transcription factor AP-1-like [Priapulus caudatus]
MTTKVEGNTVNNNRKMEQTFYDNDSAKNNDGCRMARNWTIPMSAHHNVGERSASICELKKNMTLDFSAPAGKKAKLNTVLTSPDLNLLKLGSPELERMIIAQHGMITTTPTPGQLVMFPKSVSEEQEVYAKGFADALATLQTREQRPTSQHGRDDYGGGTYSSPSYVELTMSPALPGMAHARSNGSVDAASSSSLGGHAMTSPALSSAQVKEEPQTVPCLGRSPPVSPVNMAQQEKIKLERKRLRNRLAASKCRLRKLDRIARLEEKVAGLKGQNSSLMQTATQLREQVCQLKQVVMDHRHDGCELRC